MIDFLPEILLVFAGVAGFLGLFYSASRTFLETYSGAIGIVFAVIAGVYVLKEHQISVKNERLDRTRSYIERIESGIVRDSRQWLDLHWIKRRDLISRIDEANYGENENEETAKRLLSEYEAEFDESVSDNAEGVKHIMKLAYFYADLSKCVELGLSDVKTACDLFKDDIGKFYVLHSTFIERWRKVSFQRNFKSIWSFVNKSCAGV